MTGESLKAKMGVLLNHLDNTLIDSYIADASKFVSRYELDDPQSAVMYYTLHLLQTAGLFEDISGESIGGDSGNYVKMNLGSGETKWLRLFRLEVINMQGLVRLGQ